MSVLNKIAYLQQRRDEVPNQQLARELVETQNLEGIQEIAANLWNKDVNIQSDCIKVLYETGYLAPALIAAYANDFIRLLRSRNNRLVWGAMLALSTVAQVAADALYPHVPEIQKAMAGGSVITIDAGVLTLATIAATSDERRREIFPFLLDHLQTCRPKDVPQHAEKTLAAVDASNKDQFIQVLEKRMDDMSGAQAKRVKKSIQAAQKR
jgi:hypothetical protein